jgi:hypothetical protein
LTEGEEWADPWVVVKPVTGTVDVLQTRRSEPTSELGR